MLLERTCNVCGKSPDGKRILYPARLPAEFLEESTDQLQKIHYQYHTESKGNRWHYKVVQCSGCHHRFADEVFDKETIEASYLLQQHDNEFGLDPELLVRTNEGYVGQFAPFLPKDSRGLHVDVGCDTGIFLRACLPLRFQRTIGVEPGLESAQEAAQIPGVQILRKVFDPEDFPPSSIDFLSLVHVLDHLPESRSFLQSAKSRVKTGGKVFAVVHNVESLVAKISGEAWAPFNLVHMEYFDEKSLRAFFENEGFRVLKIFSTKNAFPLHHLIRFAPYLPEFMRGPLVRLARRWPLNRLILNLKLGNIGIIAEKVAASV